MHLRLCHTFLRLGEDVPLGPALQPAFVVFTIGIGELWCASTPVIASTVCIGEACSAQSSSVQVLPTSANFTRLAHSGWAGVALVSLTLLCSVVSIIGAWWLGARSPNQPIARYLPTGNSAVFHVAQEDAGRHVGGLSLNTVQRNAAWMLRQSNAVVYTSLARAMGLGSDARDNLLVLSRAGAIFSRSVEQAEIDGTRATTITEDSYLLQSDALLLVMERASGGTFVFVPPLPVLRTDIAVDQTQVTAGVIASSDASMELSYIGALTLEAREPMQFGDRRYDDCLRMRNSLSIGARDTGFTRTWYCAGAGMVRSELFSSDGTRMRSWQLANAEAIPPASAPRMPAIGTLLTNRVDWRKPLTVAWQFDNTDGVSAITTEPIIAGDAVIVGTFTGDVIALDRNNGKERWRYFTDGPIFAPPAVADGMIYVGSGDRQVHAIDAQTGAFRWRFATHDAVIATPAVSDGVVYAGSEDRTLYALDARTGALLNAFTTGGPIAVAPAVNGDTVYAGSDDGALYALDTTALSLRWAFAAGSAVASAPLVMSGTVYFGARDGMLYALKADSASQDGEVVWRLQAREPVTGRIQWKDGALFAAAEYDLISVDAATGQLHWQQSSDGNYGSPLVLGDSIFIMTEDEIAQFDAASGRSVALFAPAMQRKYAGLGAGSAAIYASYANGDVFALAP